MDVAGDVLKFLRKNLSNDKELRILPVQIIIDAGPCLEIDRLVREGFKADWEGFHPGTIYMSPSAYKLIEKEQGIPIVPSTSPGLDQAQSFYEITLDDYKQKENALLFLYQNALCRGQNSPCFYCGSKEHAVQNCPSKHLTEMTGVLNKLGYLSFDKINDIFLAYLMSSEEAKQKAAKSLEESRRNRRPVLDSMNSNRSFSFVSSKLSGIIRVMSGTRSQRQRLAVPTKAGLYG